VEAAESAGALIGFSHLSHFDCFKLFQVRMVFSSFHGRSIPARLHSPTCYATLSFGAEPLRGSGCGLSLGLSIGCRWTKTPSVPSQRIMAVPITVSGLAFARGSIRFAGKASQALLDLSGSRPDIGASHLIDEVS